jgi:hypothetical protein
MAACDTPWTMPIRDGHGTPERDSSPPLACSLGTGELRERGEEIEALFGAYATGSERTPGGVRISLSGDDAVAERVEALVAAERECCPFLRFDLAREGDRLVLDIEGPPEAREIAESFTAPVPAT